MIIAANWKMNLTCSQASNLIEDYLTCKDILDKRLSKIFFVPSCYLFLAKEKFKYLDIKNNISYGAQNCSSFDDGAYTGDISAKMISSLGSRWVLLGHSERRINFNETSEELAKKIFNAFSNGLSVVFCVGENLTARKSGNQKQIILEQLESSFNLLLHYQKIKNLKIVPNLIIAYEPIWAIGSGLVPKIDEIEEIHILIKNFFCKKEFSLKLNFNNDIPVLYGGSVNPENVLNLISNKNINGVLVGGASLNFRDFSAICANANVK